MDNIKVHFAVSSGQREDLIGLDCAGVNYMLYTCYPYIKQKSSQQCMKADMVESKFKFKHTIMDSGLFTMMFGRDAGEQKTEHDIEEWQNRIIRFVLDNGIRSTIVECDCQKLISPEFAWGLREEIRDALPDREIMNVFHLEDGQEGFDRLVKFSDYIAISVPELRRSIPGKYKQATHAFATRAKKTSLK